MASLTPLSNLVAVSETVAPKELNRFDRQRAAIIPANIAPGYTLGEPLAATGALLTLKLTGATLNVYSPIGLVMLVGLITSTAS